MKLKCLHNKYIEDGCTIQLNGSMDSDGNFIPDIQWIAGNSEVDITDIAVFAYKFDTIVKRGIETKRICDFIANGVNFKLEG